MAMDVDKMRADGINPYLIDLAGMTGNYLKTKLAVNIENPAIFSQYLREENEANWDYAYAAGLITKAEALLLKSYEEEEEEKPGESGGRL